MKTSNPVLSNKLFAHRTHTVDARMTINGTILKTLFLLGLLVSSAMFVWSKFLATQFHHLRFVLSIAGPIPLFLGLVTNFKPRWAPITAPLYALAKGVIIGYFSSIAEMIYPGVVSQAIPLTSFVLFGMILLYSSGVIKVTKRLHAIIMVAIVSLFFTYLLEFILRLFGMTIPYIHEAGPLGIAFSGMVVVVAAFSLLLDFEFVVQMQTQGGPKYMEWYCAYALMVSLVWLYLRILELLVKMSKYKQGR